MHKTMITDKSSNEAQGNSINPLLSAVPFPNLLAEMGWYAKKKHAEIVFRKCMKAGRLKRAMKIAYHYGLQMEDRHDDTVMALGMALMATGNGR